MPSCLDDIKIQIIQIVQSGAKINNKRCKLYVNKSFSNKKIFNIKKKLIKNEHNNYLSHEEWREYNFDKWVKIPLYVILKKC